ncbi:MAG: hypothetical protein WCW44_00870 [archaeon]|jgi:uncharacterized protein (UPF0333 family)
MVTSIQKNSSRTIKQTLTAQVLREQSQSFPIECRRGQAHKGQASVEYIMLVGICLLIITFLSAYSFVSYSDSVANNQVQTSMKVLENAINEVYSLGEGNSTVVTISLPSNISNIIIQNKSLLIQTTSFGSTSDSLIEFDSNVSGSLPALEGTYDVQVKNANGVVSLNVV